MPVFNAHIPKGRFSSEEKRAIADALNQSLVQGLGIPEGDRFVMLSEHGPDELFLHPTFMEMNRDPAQAMIITVLLGAHRPLEDKRKLAANWSSPRPNEKFSFGTGINEMKMSSGETPDASTTKRVIAAASLRLSSRGR